MFIIITGLDGSGTSTIAEKFHNMDKDSILLKTPSAEFNNRDMIDRCVRETSQKAHYLYYLSSVVYMSDFIRKNIDLEKNNVYCVRYLIDTVISHRVAGLDIDLDYKKYNILEPDLTIYVSLDEEIRQNRIMKRGKSILDTILDNSNTRIKFLNEYKLFLKDSIELNNGLSNVDKEVEKIYTKYIMKG